MATESTLSDITEKTVRAAQALHKCVCEFEEPGACAEHWQWFDACCRELEASGEKAPTAPSSPRHQEAVVDGEPEEGQMVLIQHVSLGAVLPAYYADTFNGPKGFTDMGGDYFDEGDVASWATMPDSLPPVSENERLRAAIVYLCSQGVAQLICTSSLSVPALLALIDEPEAKTLLEVLNQP